MKLLPGLLLLGAATSLIAEKPLTIEIKPAEEKIFRIKVNENEDRDFGNRSIGNSGKKQKKGTAAWEMENNNDEERGSGNSKERKRKKITGKIGEKLFESKIAEKLKEISALAEFVGEIKKVYPYISTALVDLYGRTKLQDALIDKLLQEEAALAASVQTCNYEEDCKNRLENLRGHFEDLLSCLVSEISSLSEENERLRREAEEKKVLEQLLQKLAPKVQELTEKSADLSRQLRYLMRSIYELRECTEESMVRLRSMVVEAMKMASPECLPNGESKEKQEKRITEAAEARLREILSSCSVDINVNG